MDIVTEMKMGMRVMAAGVCAVVLLAGARSVLAAGGGGEALLVPTFHCMSIYWSPEGGEKAKQVLVKFRAAGETGWHEGLPMKYDPVNDWKNPGHKTPECKGDYRGAIVNLTPGTAYEVALNLEGTEVRATAKMATWSEKFPVSSTVKCQSGEKTLAVKQSGTAEGYVLYDGAGCTIDTGNKGEYGILVDANYVILRGFTIKNVKQDCIHINKGHHIVIENCDLSKWGSEDKEHVGYGVDMQAGVFSKYNGLSNVVIQRCKIHNPNWNTNSWAEDHHPGKHSPHPEGPQTIVFWECEGNNVIRYNECWSDKDHYFNDTMGGSNNNSYRGWPGRDSDIYCNYVANCWDDGIEAEGGGQNVRLWDNYIENTMMTIANAGVSIGPLYVWQNVGGRSYTKPKSEFGMTHGNFMKMGFAEREDWMTGTIYVFNNTILQPNNEGAGGLGGESRILKHCESRNNIFNVRPGDTRVIATDKKTTNAGPEYDNDFDDDLISASRYPEGAEKHAIKGVPKYVPDEGFNFETKTGDFKLAADSPGHGQAVVIPNFCDTSGKPDMGAQQPGIAKMVYGVKAGFVPAKPEAGH